MMSDELAMGRTLGSYQLLVPLAQGATADVWVARTTGSHLERVVAMKVMRTGDDDDIESESMFLDEARLVARIRHPNVASVLDLGEEDDVLYIVVEWVEGEPLQVLMREAWGTGRGTGPRRGVPLGLAVRIARQAALGLHAAHELRDELGKPMGIVHRDVSPQNILVGYDGSVKVIDFGVAKATSNLQRTQVGQIKGKVPYMAPEQAAGDEVDRRSDVFALGIVLYQLVTGTHPFRTENEYATLARIRDKKPAEPARNLVPDLPPAIDEVLEQALAKDRNARFATMADLARALERALPSSPDTDRELGTFVGALLSGRAARRGQAVKEALFAVRGPTHELPTRATGRHLAGITPTPPPVAIAVSGSDAPASASVASSSSAPASAPRSRPSSSAPASDGAPSSRQPASAPLSDPPPNFGWSPRAKIIAAAAVVGIAIAIGIAIGLRSF